VIRPRHLAHRGTVIATGFAIDPVLVGVACARRRVLAVWTPGAVVREHGGLLVVTRLRPTRVRVALAPGAPLVEQLGMVVAMPLERDEAEAIASPGAVVLVREGVAEVVPTGAMRVLDVAAWIDLTEFTVAEVEALAAPPVRAAIPAPPSADMRALAGIAAADRDAAAVLAGLLSARQGGVVPVSLSWWRRALAWFTGRRGDRSAASAASTAAASTALVPTPARRSWRDWFRRKKAHAGHAVPTRPSWTRRLLAWLSDRRAPDHSALSPGGVAPGSAATSASAPAPEPAPARPSLLDKLRDRIAEALWRSRLGAVLGRRHAAYLQHLLQLFDRGKLDEALRFAIPIDRESREDPSLGLAVPRPRQELQLSFTAPRGGTSIPIADEAIASMRNRYRAAATRLEQQGRFDEAAFVLAELLSDVPAAIALLERHGRFALAAQLAEGRGLEPGLVVRLWFLAGNRERAIDNARRHRAWGDAVARLERAGDARGAVLRMLWADHLADTGDFLQAVEVAWPVSTSRALLGAWIDRGIAAGGAVAARLLVKKLVIAPDDFPDVVPAILAILDDPEPDAVRHRRALIDELVDAPKNPALCAIARAAVRSLVRDHGAAIDDASNMQLNRLLRFAGDPALYADRPTITMAARARTAVVRIGPIALRWPASDSGAMPVHDAAVLPGGRLLLALGELGVRMIGRDGRTVAQIEQPAVRLVVSDHGTRALAIAPRGRVQRIARLDLVERRGVHWCDAECDGGAATFDGDLWIATRGREILAVDTMAARWRAVWGLETDVPSAARVPRSVDSLFNAMEPATVRCVIRREGPWFAIESSCGDAHEHWYFEGFTLRRRGDCELADARFVAAWLACREWLAVTPGCLCSKAGEIALEDAPVIALEVEADLAAVAQRSAHGVTVTVGDLSSYRALAVLELEATTEVSLRLAAGVLTLGDDRGRGIVLDPRTGVVARDLRVSG
jgi:MoxR-vWA-beta-propeller ternary system domain bpX6